MISLEEIKKFSLLARIELGIHEAEELQKDIGAILDYVSRLKEAPPSPRLRRARPSDTEETLAPKISNVLRNDEPAKDESAVRKGEHVKVKHILEN